MPNSFNKPSDCFWSFASCWTFSWLMGAGPGGEDLVWADVVAVCALTGGSTAYLVLVQPGPVLFSLKSSWICSAVWCLLAHPLICSPAFLLEVEPAELLLGWYHPSLETLELPFNITNTVSMTMCSGGSDLSPPMMTREICSQ